MRVGFFDRDGTIIHDYPDEQWRSIHDPVFVDGAISVLKHLVNQGFQIIVITNQYLINEGYITQNQYETVTAKMLSELEVHGISILAVFYCPHARNEGCKCIKPNTGMVDQALEKYPNIELSESFVVGDSNVDMQLARNLGIKGFGINVSFDCDNIRTIESISELHQHFK